MRRNSLVDDALAKTLQDMLNERPIDKITVEEIAEASGLSKRTFYNHFRDKHDLVSYIWRRAYESCWTEGERFLSCEESLIKYHKLEEELQTFFLNTLPYTGQNNLWETVNETGVEYTKLQMRNNGFVGEFDDEIMNAVNFWVLGISGISRSAFENQTVRHIGQAALSPEERTRRELTLIPAILRPWLVPGAE